MLKKLTETKKKMKKKDFIERKAAVHICDGNCMFACLVKDVLKLSLMSALNAD